MGTRQKHQPLLSICCSNTPLHDPVHTGTSRISCCQLKSIVVAARSVGPTEVPPGAYESIPFQACQVRAHVINCLRQKRKQ